MVARCEGCLQMTGRGEGIKKYELAVTKQSRGREVQRRERRQSLHNTCAQCQVGPDDGGDRSVRHTNAYPLGCKPDTNVILYT